MSGADLQSLERDLQIENQDLELAHRWLNALERAPLEIRNRPFVADLLQELASTFPHDRRVVYALDERWRALGRKYYARERVEDWHGEMCCKRPRPLSNLGALVVPPLCRLLSHEQESLVRFALSYLAEIGPTASLAFEVLLAKAGSQTLRSSELFSYALRSIEPDPVRAASRVRRWFEVHSDPSICSVLEQLWTTTITEERASWWATLAQSLRLPLDLREDLDERINATPWPLEVSAFRAPLLCAAAHLLGDQPHFHQRLSEQWTQLTPPQRQPVLDSLHQWQTAHPRVNKFILNALEAGLARTSQLSRWDWTSIPAAFKLLPALRRDAQLRAERRYCALALANLSRHHQQKLSNDRDASKIKTLLGPGLALAIDLARDDDPRTARSGLSALSRFSSSTLCETSPEASAILRKALLSGDPERVRAAATTGLWPLSQADLLQLQNTSRTARRPLRRSLNSLCRQTGEKCAIRTGSTVQAGSSSRETANP